MHPRARSYRLTAVVSGVGGTMNCAGTYAGGVRPVVVAGGEVCHVNGVALGCRGMPIRTACGIVGRPVLVGKRRYLKSTS